MRRRFRSTNDWRYGSAFFELFLHELLLRLRCHIQIHPRLKSGARKSPDFLVQCPTGRSFYVEAVLATDESREEAGARARMNTVYDLLNRSLDSPDFFVGVHLRGYPKAQPSGRDIVSFLANHLVQVDHDQVAEEFKKSGFTGLPHWFYERSGWRIEFFPIPKSPGLRGKPGVRPLGLQFEGVHWVDSRTAIRNAVLTKAKRYGNLDLPYVICVNALGKHVDRIDVMEALFGKEQFTVRLTQLGPSKPVMSRMPDGAWTSELGPIYKRVSAVLIMSPIFPWNVPRAPVCLYHNPWARRRYESALTCLPQGVPEDDRMVWRSGESLGTIFGLPPTWPEG
jgi:hypothetical protein